MNEFLEQFLIESRELVEQATDDLVALEQFPDDHARLDGAFRGFHTLKGAAGIMEFAAMGRALHAAEDLLAAVRAGDYPVTADLIGNCLACLDQIGRWLDALETTGELPADADLAASDLIAKFAAPDQQALVAAPVVSATDDRPAWTEQLLAHHAQAVAARTALRYAPDADCFFRGEDPLALAARLPGLLALDLQPREAWPSLAELDPFACNLIILALSSSSADRVADHLRAVRAQVQIHALPGQADADSATLPPDRATAILQAQMALLSEPADGEPAGRWGSAGRAAGNVLRYLGLDEKAAEIDAALATSLAAADPSALIAAIGAILNGPTEVAEHLGTHGPQGATTSPREAATRALRVDVERIDAIVKLTGELTVVKNALGHAARLALDGSDPSGLAQTLKQQHALLQRLTEELQRSVLAIRVLPLRHVFHRFPRLVRELAGSLGKTARLVSDGGETEADKAVVDVLFEPLLHVLRNAVDHGIEAADQRAAAGKSETGTIRLRGHRAGEHVIIEVEDDGGGIDTAKVRRVAMDRGLAASDVLAALPDDEVVDLIFAPGFSTAAGVTNISGRGVGMDVVRSTIEQLGGRVTVQSRAGEGTTVRFTLPFTVMMTRVVAVEAAGQVLGVPFDAVVETLQLPRDRIIPVGAAEAFVLRGRTVPLVSLARALDLDPNPRTSPFANIVVIETGGQLGALEVDRFGERLDVMLQPMNGLLAGMNGIAGTTLLGDGRVLIVLDIQELLQ